MRRQLLVNISYVCLHTKGYDQIIILSSWGNHSVKRGKRPARILLAARWIRLHTPSGGGLSFISSQGTRSHMPQLRLGTAK